MGLFDFFKANVSNSGVDISKRYALLREAVSGTMSKFYKAKDLRTGQIVGLKILDREKTAAFEDRFRGLKKPTEGEMGMLLKHPLLIETLEHGTTSDGSQYIALEFIDGPDFASLIIGRDPVLDGNRVHFIRKAAEAVAAMHAAGFVHRDVAPRNFLLSDRPKKELKLIDFGVSLPCLPQFQHPGVRTGNPNYMSPEIVRRKPTDQRVDVFAFGASAYEICTGELPWLRGNTGMAAMSHDKPPVDIRKYRPKLHPELAKAIHWCLEAEPAARCPSMEKFLQAIRTVDRDEV
ncbi:MAG: serine/threonine protein kinase [Thermoguttaceae bacterium]